MGGCLAGVRVMSTQPAQTRRSSGVTKALKGMNLKLEETFGNVFSDEECDIDVAKLTVHQTLIAAPRLHV